MENNLLNNIKSYFSEEVINKLSANLGESNETIHKGLDLSIPSILLGLQGKSSDGLSSVLTSAKHLFGSFDFNNVFGNFFGSPSGTDNSKFETQNVLSSIFGEKFNGIIESLASYLGIKSESVSGLLGASLPAIIAGITNKGSNWDANGIGSLLNDNKSAFAAAIPTGLGLGAFGSLFANADTPKEIPSHTTQNVASTPTSSLNNERIHTPQRVEEEKKGGGLWWLLIPIALIALWLLFGKSCQNNDKKEEVVTDTIVTDSATIVEAPTEIAQREYIDVALPGGTTLKAYRSGIEENLISFLQSDYKNLSEDELKDKWFDFDNLNFETGTANVVPESRQQLENIAAILKLFPDAKIKIGGYTDKTGDEAINKKISKERADAVLNFLKEKGLSNQVIDAEGYGSEFAKVPADASDEERAKDRRVAVSVRK